jgi:hypothetical protein
LLEFAEQADNLLFDVGCNTRVLLNTPFRGGLYTSNRDHHRELREGQNMAISYKDARRAQGKRGASGPILVAVLVVGGLLMLGPRTTSMLETTLASVLQLPVR